MKKKKFNELYEEDTSLNSPENKRSSFRADAPKEVNNPRKIKFSDRDFSEHEDSSTVLKKTRPGSSSDESETTTTPSESENEESNLKSSGDETPQSPYENNGQECDDLWYSPATPATRDRSGAIDSEDPTINRSYAYNFRDPNGTPFPTPENSPSSTSWTPTSINDNENQTVSNYNNATIAISLDFASLGMTFIGDTDLSS